jgi:steroid 5-alpha reductase family enzyme
MIVLGMLGWNALALFMVILALWGISVRIRDVSFIDAFWAFGMVLLSWFSWTQIAAPSMRANLILALVTIWGIRLALHLFTRWRAHGEDPRYKKIMAAAIENKGWSWNKTALLQVFLLQAPLLFITCLPAQLGITAGGSSDGINLLAWMGAVAALAGIVFETVGDAQLNAFRANPANAGKVLNTGLWRYTRHPNYFGDFLTWWGIWLVAASAGTGIAIASIIGPAFLSFTLMKWSGGPLLERGLKKSRPGYSEYIATTSPFFPRPPKKLN